MHMHTRTRAPVRVHAPSSLRRGVAWLVADFIELFNGVKEVDSVRQMQRLRSQEERDRGIFYARKCESAVSGLLDKQAVKRSQTAVSTTEFFSAGIPQVLLPAMPPVQLRSTFTW